MNPISKYISKRSRCINSTAESYTDIRYESIYSAMKNNPSEVKVLAENYIKGQMSVANANKNYPKFIGIMNYLEENKVNYNSIVESFKDMLFYITDMATLDNSLMCIKNDTVSNSLLEESAYISMVDRITTNANIINSKFDFEDKIYRMRYRDISSIVESAVDMLSEYKMQDYQKMNVIIEQLTYVAAKHNFSYNGDMPKEVMEYFITHTNEKKENIFRVLQESPIVNQEDLDNINRMINFANDIQNITLSIERLCSYLLFHFTGEYAYNPVELVYTTFKRTSVEDICHNIRLFFNTYYKVLRNTHSLDAMINAIRAKELNYTDLKMIKDAIDDIDFQMMFRDEAKEVYDHVIEPISDILNNIYSSDNIEAIKTLAAESTTISLNELKIFKFNGILKAIHNLDKFLAGKERVLVAKAKNKFKVAKNKLTNILFGESNSYIKDNIYQFIGADNKADITVRQYYIEDYEAMLNYLNTVIKEFNYSLDIDKLTDIRAYYTITEGLAEVHIKYSRPIELSDEEIAIVRESIDPSKEIYYDILDYVVELSNEYKDLPVNDINNLVAYDTIRECINLTPETLDAMLESMKYLGITKDQVADVVQAYDDIQFEKSLTESALETNNKKLVEVWKSYEGEVPIEIALEAYEILSTIIIETSCANGNTFLSESTIEDHMRQNGYTWDDEDPKKKDEDDDEDEKPNKKPVNNNKKPTKKPSQIYGDGEDLPKDDEKKKTGLRLNDVVLAAKGLAGKIKQYSGKVREKMVNLDHSINSFLNNIKRLDSNNRRERIIKGSIIPSFNQVINTGVVLIGLGVATGGIVAPVIAAIGAIAIDKRLTQKEKLLLLDEIETELEVIDKELAIADQNNQINKYRALLRYKKDLQRQYQRIRYNVRVGQDTAMFSSSVGTSSGKE